MRYIRTAFSLATVIALAGCGHKYVSPLKPAPEQIEHDVTVTVATGCIAKEGRPGMVAPISKTVSAANWKVLTATARANAVKAQAGRRMNYEDVDRAATSACK